MGGKQNSCIIFKFVDIDLMFNNSGFKTSTSFKMQDLAKNFVTTKKTCILCKE